MVQLAFIGTGTCNASNRKPQALVFSINGDLVCVDFGGGAYHGIASLGHEHFHYQRISTVVLTHFHVDHVSGLPDLLWGQMWDHAGCRTSPLRLVGPKGLNSFYTDRLLPFIGSYDIPFDIECIELKSGDVYQSVGYSVQAAELAHGESSLGYRFDFGGTSVAVTGDTGYCDALLTLLSSVDSAVIEWSIIGDDEYPLHISTRDMVRLLSMNAWPPRMAAIHIYPSAQSDASEQLNKMKLLAESCHKTIEFPRDGDIITIVP